VLSLASVVWATGDVGADRSQAVGGDSVHVELEQAGRPDLAPCHDPQFCKIGGLSALAGEEWELTDVL